jgi:hypothetical protein
LNIFEFQPAATVAYQKRQRVISCRESKGP